MINRFRKLSSLVLCLFLSNMAYAATLLDLKVDFNNNAWKEILTRQWGSHGTSVVRNRTDKCLELPPGSCITTQNFPYVSGKITVGCDIKSDEITQGKEDWHIGAVQVTFYRGTAAVGHQDVYLNRQKSDWKNHELKLSCPAAGVDSFVVNLVNYGSAGKMWVDNLKVTVEVEGKDVCGDPSFQGMFGIDHWFPKEDGKDWDKLSLASPRSTVEVAKNIFSDSGKSLHLKNMATVSSVNFIYNGEELYFGAWMKQKGIVRANNKPCWANAGIQIVAMDENGNPLGHYDLTTKLSDGTLDWKYYQATFPKNFFNRKTKKIALWVRVFDGAKGDLWADNIRIIRGVGKDRIPYNISGGVITVDTESPGPEIKPTWACIDLPYASLIGHVTAKEALAKMRKAGIENLRMREFLSDNLLQGFDKNGNPILDFSYYDKLLDYAVNELGFDITPTIETTPRQMVSKNNGSTYSPPKDVKAWGKIVQALVEHWIDRYGKERVSRWRFECWNEPGATFFDGTEKEFVEVYAAYMNAMLAAEKSRNVSLQIGTPSGIDGVRSIFADQRKRGTLKNIDSFDIHLYAGFTCSFDNFGMLIDDYYREMDSYPELKGKPIYVTEYNADSMSSPYLDTHTCAALNVKAAREFLDKKIAGAYFYSLVDQLYQQREDHFHGDLGIFTNRGIPKAVFHSFTLLNQLKGGKRLNVSRSNDPLDAIAAIQEDGTIKILVTTFAEANLDSSEKSSVRLELPWGGRSKNISPSITIVDKNHGDPYTKFAEMGKPKAKDNPELKEVLPYCEIKEVPLKDYRFDGDKLVFELKLQLNSLAMITIPGKTK